MRASSAAKDLAVSTPGSFSPLRVRRSSRSTYPMATAPPHATKNVNTNISQNHAGTCRDHTLNAGGGNGGGAAGGQMINGGHGGVAGGRKGGSAGDGKTGNGGGATGWPANAATTACSASSTAPPTASAAPLTTSTAPVTAPRRSTMPASLRISEKGKWQRLVLSTTP